MSLYFNSSHLPSVSSEYIAWVDVMGTQSSMSRSLHASANFIFKLHIAALHSPHENVQIYPVMDGFYAASPNQRQLLDFLRSVFQLVADEFNQTENSQHRFVIRGALAFGHVVHGNGIGAEASTVLAGNAPYRNSVLLGLPIVQAHAGENSAPPFGLFIHESARAFAPAGVDPLHVTWWKWNNPANQSIWTALQESLPQHLTWCLNRCLTLGYAADRIKVHEDMVRQYFAI